MEDLTRSETISLIIYGCFGLYLATTIPSLFRGRFLSGVLALCAWVMIFGIALVGYTYRAELTGIAQRVIATVVPGTPIQTAPGQVTIYRGQDGSFEVKGQAGPARLGFILDTGASMVVLRAEDATRAGIKVKRLTYDIDVATANGHALTAAATLPRLVIGDIVETDIPVLVAKSGAMPENLLGMTFLNRLASFTVASNKLVLQGR